MGRKGRERPYAQALITNYYIIIMLSRKVVFVCRADLIIYDRFIMKIKINNGLLGKEGNAHTPICRISLVRIDPDSNGVSACAMQTYFVVSLAQYPGRFYLTQSPGRFYLTQSPGQSGSS